MISKHETFSLESNHQVCNIDSPERPVVGIIDGECIRMHGANENYIWLSPSGLRELADFLEAIKASNKIDHFRLGYDAYEQSCEDYGHRANPYQEGSAEWEEWRKGWNCAVDDDFDKII